MKNELINEYKSKIQNGFNNTPQWIKDLMIAILNKYGKYIYDYSWFSGGSTEIFPIEVYPDFVEVQLNTRDKRHFMQKGLDSMVKSFPNLKFARYCEYDGSCPDALIFAYKEPLC